MVSFISCNLYKNHSCELKNMLQARQLTPWVYVAQYFSLTEWKKKKKDNAENKRLKYIQMNWCLNWCNSRADPSTKCVEFSHLWIHQSVFLTIPGPSLDSTRSFINILAAEDETLVKCAQKHLKIKYVQWRTNYQNVKPVCSLQTRFKKKNSVEEIYSSFHKQKSHTSTMAKGSGKQVENHKMVLKM